MVSHWRALASLLRAGDKWCGSFAFLVLPGLNPKTPRCRCWLDWPWRLWQNRGQREDGQDDQRFHATERHPLQSRDCWPSWGKIIMKTVAIHVDAELLEKAGSWRGSIWGLEVAALFLLNQACLRGAWPDETDWLFAAMFLLVGWSDGYIALGRHVVGCLPKNRPPRFFQLGRIVGKLSRFGR